MIFALLIVKNLFSCEENPKHEYRNPKQIQKLQKENPQRLGRVFRRFQFWDLRFVSDFGFRISNLAAAAGCGAFLRGYSCLPFIVVISLREMFLWVPSRGA